jgi:hypothetical protein
MAKKTSKKKTKKHAKTESDKRSEKAFQITCNVKEDTYKTLLSVRAGMLDV